MARIAKKASIDNANKMPSLGIPSMAMPSVRNKEKAQKMRHAKIKDADSSACLKAPKKTKAPTKNREPPIPLISLKLSGLKCHHV